MNLEAETSTAAAVAGAAMPMVVNCVAYDDTGKRLPPITIDEISDVLARPDTFVWVGLHEPTEAMLDKLETILQHTQGANPPDFDYRFNLGYGRRYTEAPPLLAELRAILDAETERRAREGA